MKLTILFIANFIGSVAMGIALTIAPWKLSSSIGGEKVLAFTASYATAILIFVSPVAGRIVDQFSRRASLVVCVVLMGAALQIAALTYPQPALRVVSLAIFYFASQLFFLFFYNALSAFIQEAFAEQDRGKVNGWMQVEIQLSSLVTGVLMIFIIKSDVFAFVLMLNGLLLLASGGLLFFIPYKRQKPPERAHFSGFVFAKILERKDLLVLGLCAKVTFVCVMLLNVVHPIYLNNVLQMDVSALATQSIVYGLAAAISGFWVSRFVTKSSAVLIMRTSLTGFAAALLMICLLPEFAVIVAGAGALGATGSAMGVAFNTYIMSMVDQSIFGRYLSVVSTLTYIQRTLFGLGLAFLIAGYPAANYYWFVLGVCGIGLVLMQVYLALARPQQLTLSLAE